MKRTLSLFVIVTLVAVASFASLPVSAAQSETFYTVVFEDNSLPANAAELVSAAGGRLVNSLPEVGIGFALSSDAGFAANLSASTLVLAVGEQHYQALPATQEIAYELDAPTVADDLYNIYQWDIRRVNADQAWEAGVTGSHVTVVAVIDTGVDNTHPDLAPNVVFRSCYNLASLAGTGSCSPDPDPDGEHGTHVAGTIAAAFDGGRVVGVGPNLGIAGYNVFEPGAEGAWDGPIWAAMINAANNGFDVINMSLGGYGAFPDGGAADWVAWNRVVNYVNRMGVTIVASSGNGDVNLNGALYHIPSDLPGIISVGATGIQPDPFYPQADAYDIRAFYSNFGAATTVVAPGGDCGEISTCSGAPPSGYPYYMYLVLSTMPGGGYAWMGGTSMASPHVAGVAGLIIDANPKLKPNQVEAIIKQTAENLGDRQLFGHGMVDAYAAVMRAAK